MVVWCWIREEKEIRGEKEGGELTRMFMYLGSPLISAKLERNSVARTAGEKREWN